MALGSSDLSHEAEAVVWAGSAAADAFHTAAVKTLPTVEMKPCSRCEAKGYAYFHGGNNAPGVCFKCAGKGKVVAHRSDIAMLTKLYAKIEVERLRILYRALTLGLSYAKAAVAANEWPSKSLVRDLEARRVSVTAQGKAEAAKL